VIQLIVLTLRGTPLTQTLAGVFGPAGGTLGRAPSNTLVLDDPDRTVSRVHAQLLCRDGAFFAVDRGSNPMQHNGRTVGSGNEVPLADGDRLLVGGFELEVKAYNTAATAHAGTAAPAVALAASAGASDDPFADLLSGIAPAARPPGAAPPAPTADSLRFPDPLAGAPAQARQDDPFADLLGPGPSSASSPASAPAAARSGGLLDDFSDLGGAGVHGGGSGIDALFGGMDSGGSGGDPLALSPLADPLDLPRTADAADPFAALQGGARPSAPATQSDHVPMGQFAYRPPAVAKPAVAAPAPAFDDLTGLPHDAAEPALAAAPPESAAHTPRATDDELLAALLRGLASTHQPPQMLTPGLMERIGVALRAATEGTLHLLLARQEFKREVRAEVTLIASKANNPLKFSPTAEIALAHLLGPGMRGFMPPEAAMRDAYDDLRAHQFGVMVGMRAALAHVIARFEPAELEKKIASKSALDSLFAANRKARLWDQFVALYGGIAADAEDDFHSLFGKAFVEAYEAQMKQLKAEAPRRTERE